MIGRLTGLLLEKTPPRIMLDVGGIGYEVEVPMSSFYHLPELGQSATLLTHFIVREDAQLLYGFLTLEEKNTFRELVKISGVGPRTALAVLSGLSTIELAQAVSSQETGRLIKVPGIGKKTAERLLLELKGKLGSTSPSAPHNHPMDTLSDITQALVALGYSEKDALAASKSLPAEVSVSQGIKLALNTLNR
jgi:Holliday junction DNA helicase RuvA